MAFQASSHRIVTNLIYDDRRVDACVQTLLRSETREERVHRVIMVPSADLSVRHEQIAIYQYAGEDLDTRGCVCSTHVPSGHLSVDLAVLPNDIGDPLFAERLCRDSCRQRYGFRPSPEIAFPLAGSLPFAGISAVCLRSTCSQGGESGIAHRETMTWSASSLLSTPGSPQVSHR